MFGEELALVEGDPSRVTLPALMDLAVDAMYVDFRKLLEDTPYTDVRPTHGCVFRFVHDEGMRLTELASKAGLTKQSVGEIVDNLTGLGYIERFPDPTDKRAKLIRLTAKGRRALRRAGRVRGTLTLRFLDSANRSVTRSKKVTLKRR